MELHWALPARRNDGEGAREGRTVPCSMPIEFLWLSREMHVATVVPSLGTLSIDLFLSIFQKRNHLVEILNGWSSTVEDCRPPIHFVLTGSSRAFDGRHIRRPSSVRACAE